MGKTDISAVLDFCERSIEAQKEYEKFITDCAKALMAELLSRIKKNTPKSENKTIRYYEKGGQVGVLKQRGGRLQAGWTGGKEMNEREYVKGLSVKHQGHDYVLTVVNDTEYATFVEVGHYQDVNRYVPYIGDTDENGVVTGARLKRPFVYGQFPVRISEAQIEKFAPAYLEKKLAQWLRENFEA